MMIERTTLLTVRGGQGSIDVEVPNGLPIQELLPKLLDALSMASGNRVLDNADVWGLGEAHAALPLSAQLTLQEAGILDGAELLLQDMAAWKRGTQMQRPAPPPAVANEHGLSVRWHAVDDWQNS